MSAGSFSREYIVLGCGDGIRQHGDLFPGVFGQDATVDQCPNGRLVIVASNNRLAPGLLCGALLGLPCVHQGAGGFQTLPHGAEAIFGGGQGLASSGDGGKVERFHRVASESSGVSNFLCCQILLMSICAICGTEGAPISRGVRGGRTVGASMPAWMGADGGKLLAVEGKCKRGIFNSGWVVTGWRGWRMASGPMRPPHGMENT